MGAAKDSTITVKMLKMMNSLNDFAWFTEEKNDIKGVILTEWVPKRSIVNQPYYKEVLKKIRETVRKKRQQMWKNCFLLHQDDATAQTALCVKQFMINSCITIHEHPPYSPDLEPCDFLYFSKC